jgi:hypothetical protein
MACPSVLILPAWPHSIPPDPAASPRLYEESHPHGIAVQGRQAGNITRNGGDRDDQSISAARDRAMY